MVQRIHQSIKQTPIPDNSNWKGGIDFQLEQKIEYGLLHVITIEVLRLEVKFCYPDMPNVLENEGFLFKATHLRDYVFKHKLNNVSNKISELKKEMLNRGSTIMEPIVENSVMF
ncbi:hypothetical protein TorRG33x02_192070 [Trema orientale]|uniref:Uncharacterized protein n=1 Tax=Trema orientale TaxID=63057 RepID=A0A2P5EHD7_TREOI|nr:hypothetical protein TorRG33x02_192070 [Trema orientale]